MDLRSNAPAGRSDLHSISDELLDRYLGGHVTSEERVYVEQVMREVPVGAQWVEAVRAMPHREMARLRMERVAELVEAKIAKSGDRDGIAERATKERTAPQTGHRTWNIGGMLGRPRLYRHSAVWIGVAAGLLMLVFGGLALRTDRSQPETRRVHTAPGQQSTIRLADGSTMMLAPASSAVIGSQEIDVQGEAYFTVVPHPTRPFIVTTRNARVNVLGTRFAVRQYPGDDRSRVVVEDGRVALQTLHASRQSQTPVVVSARMLAQVTDSGVTVTPSIATGDYTSWTRGMLVFDEMPLKDVLVDLTRAYGVSIVIADSALAAQRMTLEISVTEQSVTQILDLIGEISNAHYTQRGRTYVLSSGRQITPGESPVRRLQERLPQPERQYGR